MDDAARFLIWLIIVLVLLWVLFRVVGALAS